MNWDAIGALGEVAGAVAVVLTLVYLAKQIHHSNKLDNHCPLLGFTTSYHHCHLDFYFK